MEGYYIPQKQPNYGKNNYEYKKLCNNLEINWRNIYLPICKDWNKNYKTNLSQFQKIGIKTIKQIYWNFRKLG